MAVGAGILAVSLGFRTVDEAVCGAVPIGTHFLWHLLNAVLLGWMIRVLVRHEGRRAGACAGRRAALSRVACRSTRTPRAAWRISPASR